MKRKSGVVPIDRLNFPLPGRETLERLKRWPGLRDKFKGKVVMIYSGEHHGFWRNGLCGYVEIGSPGAATMSLDAAFEVTKHCCPKKKIEFHAL